MKYRSFFLIIIVFIWVWQGKAQVYIPQFIVNDEAYNAYHKEDTPIVGLAENGDVVVIWQEDVRFSKVYGRIYDDQNKPITSVFIVSDSSSFMNRLINLVVERNGDFVVAWIQQIDKQSLYKIKVRKFDKNGNPENSAQTIAELSSLPLRFSICSNDSGRMALAWDEKYKSEYHIKVKILDSEGMAVAEKTVNQNLSTEAYGAAVAMNLNGDVFVTWTSQPNIFLQILTADGIICGPNFKVYQSSSSYGFMPLIDIANDGRFIICWSEYSQSKIFARLFYPYGMPMGTSFQVGFYTPFSTSPSVAFDDSGNFAVGWDVYDNKGTKIFAQIYDQNGSPVTNKSTIIGSELSLISYISLAARFHFVLAWSTSEGDLFLQRFNNQGQLLGESLLINDTFIPGIQIEPRIGVDRNGNFTIVWWDFPEGEGAKTIKGQRFNRYGQRIANNFVIPDDSTNLKTDKSSPDLSMNDDGRYVIVWGDARNQKKWDIYGQIYDSSGISLGPNFCINDENSPGFSPVVAMDSVGNFTVTWLSIENSMAGIRVKRYYENGKPANESFLLNIPASKVNLGPPVITMGNSGNCIIAWSDDRDMGNINACQLDSDGKVRGDVFDPFDGTRFVRLERPSLAMADNGGFIIAWLEKSADLKYYAQSYDKQFQPVAKNFTIGHMMPDWGDWVNILSGRQDRLSLSLNSTGQWIAAWVGDDRGLYAQRYHNLIYEYGGTYQINYFWEFVDGSRSQVVLKNGIVYFAWAGHYLRDINVFALVIPWDMLYILPVKEVDDLLLQSNFARLQNYPNPFNDATNIVVELPRQSLMLMNIYNIIGQKVRALTSEQLPAGQHTIIWDGLSDAGQALPSGIYFCRMQAGNTLRTRKMILLR